jgi:hypothetical protein
LVVLVAGGWWGCGFRHHPSPKIEDEYHKNIRDGVTHIWDFAPCESKNLKSIAIPASVVSIMESAFRNCDSLTSITVAADNRHYVSEDGVLFNRSQTTLIRYPPGREGAYTIPSDVRAIGAFAFHGSTGLTSVTIPDSVSAIGGFAFWGCTGLTSVTIGNSVANIGDSAFHSSADLTSVTIPRRVVSIGNGAFSDNTYIIVAEDNVFYSSVDGVLLEKKQNTSIHCAYTVSDTQSDESENPMGTYLDESENPSNARVIMQRQYTSPDPTLKDDGTLIIRYTLWNDSYRQCIEFKDSISITNIVIEKNVTSINPTVFNGCSDLMSIDVHEDNSRYTSIDGVLFKNEINLQRSLVRFPQGRQGAYTVPEGVMFIKKYAFSGSTGLTSVMLPRAIVEEGAFSGCTGLTSVTFRDGVGEIMDNTFKNCISLTSFTIPSNTNYISPTAFWGCTSLTYIDVRKYNFRYVSVDGVLFHKNISDGSLLSLVRYPPGKQGASYTIPDGVVSIEDYAFEGTSLTSVVIPPSVSKVGRTLFYNCKNLTSITVLSWNPPIVDSGPLGAPPRSLMGRRCDACLYVPLWRIRAYRSAEGWKEFKCIKARRHWDNP